MLPVHITPKDAKALVDNGALLVDVREADEHAREHIPGSKLMPLSEIAGAIPNTGDAANVVYHCKSGGRTDAAAEHLIGLNGVQTFIIDGGIDAWRKAGLPTRKDASKPIELMRQVQIAAGLLIMIGVAGGVFIHPALYGIAGFVGAGLTFAGVTGFCGMARLLQRMPWNRRTLMVTAATPAGSKATLS